MVGIAHSTDAKITILMEIGLRLTSGFRNVFQQRINILQDCNWSVLIEKLIHLNLQLKWAMRSLESVIF